MTTDYNGDGAGAEHHSRTSRRLIRQANYELARRGDRVQASDKAAGAVAHAVKAIAETRNWRHDSHNNRRRIVDLLSYEYDLPELTDMQAAADQLHDNFYEDLLEDYQVQRRLRRVTELLEVFTELRQQGPNPGFVPTPAQERSLNHLRLTPEEAAARESIQYPPPLPDFGEPEE